MILKYLIFLRNIITYIIIDVLHFTVLQIHNLQLDILSLKTFNEIVKRIFILKAAKIFLFKINNIFIQEHSVTKYINLLKQAF